MKKIILALSVIVSVSLSAQTGDLFSGPPVLRGAKVVGNYPNTDFLFTIPATGDRPMEFEAERLPAGLTLDRKTGFITGKITNAGEYNVTVIVKNKSGKVSEDLKIVVGDKLCLTPPLGWNSWNVFTSDVNEKLVIEIADAMVANGMRDLGYEYINLDDYWHAPQREADGRPKADPVKFPHGMKYLSDYMHSKGLKLGIYSCAGTMTCGKQFGGYQHEEIDAKTYAEWGIDLLKYDYCFAPKGQKDAIERYTAMGSALKKSGRSIVFSICEWGGRKPGEWGATVGGSYWRTTGDIVDAWKHTGYNTVTSIIQKQKGLEKNAGPGHWNDPDMLIVGNHGTGKATSRGGTLKGLTQDEYYTHFAMWCMLDAPLLTSCDMRNVSKEDLAIMANPTLLAISQDELGEEAHQVKTKGGMWFYQKRMKDNSYAIAVINTGNKAKDYKMNAADFGLPANPSQIISAQTGKADFFTQKTVPSHGTLVFIVR